jgi:hypothetical protein
MQCLRLKGQVSSNLNCYPASDETDLHALFHILKLPIPISTPWYSRNASLYGPVVPVLVEV